MKKYKIFLLISFFATILSINVMGQYQEKRQQTGHGHENDGSIGAPLDGGLLTVLGAAGIGYFVVRKKRKFKDV